MRIAVTDLVPNKPDASLVELAVPFGWIADMGSGVAVKGVSGYMKAYSKWDYTKQAMDYWAQLLRKRLNSAHGK